MNTFIISNVRELPQVAKAIFEASKSSKIFFLYGDLGAGKTTLVKSILQQLNSKDEATSPTYSLVNPYEYPDGIVYHMDLYRLNSVEEALDIGIEEYLESGNLCFIEWPALISPLVPDDVVKINIEILGEGKRKIIIS